MVGTRCIYRQLEVGGRETQDALINIRCIYAKAT